MKPFKRFKFMALFAILSFICYIQTGMYIAEKTGTVLWVVLGSVFALLALWQLYIINKQAGSGE